MAAELKLQPGWLSRDVSRASESVKSWEADKASKQGSDPKAGSKSAPKPSQPSSEKK